MRAQRGVYPADVTGSVQYGPGVRALVTQLSVDHKMPLEQICRLFEDLFGHALNSETVEAALEQGYELAAAVEAATVERLKRAEVAHCDEKGSGEAVLAAHRGQQPVYPSVCASQARGRCLAQRCVGAQGFRRTSDS